MLLPRILYHHRTQGRGGEGVHIREVIRALRKLGCEVEMQEAPGVDAMFASETQTAPTPQEAPPRLHSRVFKYLSQHAPQFVFEIAELGYNFWAWFPLSRRLRRERIDILYERYAFFSFVGTWLARRRNIPSVLEVNEISGIERTRGQAMPGLARRIEAAVFSRADRILVVSSFLKDALVERGVEEGKIHVLPNAVREDMLAGDERPGEQIRVRLGLEGRTVVGFVGQIAPWDRLDLLIEDVARLLPELPDLHLLIVGPCRFMDELRRQVGDLSLQHAVTLTGPVERNEVAAYIDAMDICVLPHSNPFGSPIVMFEYMAMKKPVLAVDVRPVRDVISDEINGCLFPAGDREEFRQRMTALVTDSALRKRIGRKGYEDVRTRHTWNRNAEQILEIIREIV
ncbi:glycosyltransferase family 4 protein [Thiolapillus sp.]